jgi:hypothetical protein
MRILGRKHDVYVLVVTRGVADRGDARKLLETLAVSVVRELDCRQREGIPRIEPHL